MPWGGCPVEPLGRSYWAAGKEGKGGKGVSAARGGADREGGAGEGREGEGVGERRRGRGG